MPKAARSRAAGRRSRHARRRQPGAGRPRLDRRGLVRRGNRPLLCLAASELARMTRPRAQPAAGHGPPPIRRSVAPPHARPRVERVAGVEQDVGPHRLGESAGPKVMYSGHSVASTTASASVAASSGRRDLSHGPRAPSTGRRPGIAADDLRPPVTQQRGEGKRGGVANVIGSGLEGEPQHADAPAAQVAIGIRPRAGRPLAPAGCVHGVHGAASVSSHVAPAPMAIMDRTSFGRHDPP